MVINRGRRGGGGLENFHTTSVNVLCWILYTYIYIHTSTFCTDMKFFRRPLRPRHKLLCIGRPPPSPHPTRCHTAAALDKPPLGIALGTAVNGPNNVGVVLFRRTTGRWSVSRHSPKCDEGTEVWMKD